VNAVMNCRVPQNAEDFLTSSETIGIPKSTLIAEIIIIIIIIIMAVQ
jgi:hypothetical protein